MAHKHLCRTRTTILILLACWPIAGSADTPQEVARRVFPSVVMVIMEDALGNALSQGSGFFIREDALVTNFHVIKGAAKGHIRFIGSSHTYQLTGVLASHEERDLAVLKVAIQAPFLRLADTTRTVVGDDVYAVGNPQGLDGTFSQGIVSAIREIKNVKVIQVTAPASPGSSGGPVVNKQGEVIGVVSWGLRGGQNLNFAVSSAYLPSLLSTPSLLPFKFGATAAPSPPKSAAELEWSGRVALESETVRATRARCVRALRYAQFVLERALLSGHVPSIEAASDAVNDNMACIKAADDDLTRLAVARARGFEAAKVDAQKPTDTYHRELAILLQGLATLAPQLAPRSTLTFEAFSPMMSSFQRDYEAFRLRHRQFLGQGASPLAVALMNASAAVISSVEPWRRERELNAQSAAIKAQMALAETAGLTVAHRDELRTQTVLKLQGITTAATAAANERYTKWQTFQQFVQQASTLAASGNK